MRTPGLVDEQDKMPEARTNRYVKLGTGQVLRFLETDGAKQWYEEDIVYVITRLLFYPPVLGVGDGYASTLTEVQSEPGCVGMEVVVDGENALKLVRALRDRAKNDRVCDMVTMAIQTLSSAVPVKHTVGELAAIRQQLDYAKEMYELYAQIQNGVRFPEARIGLCNLVMACVDRLAKLSAPPVLAE